MVLFKKRETVLDTLDFTDLDKRGLLKAHQSGSQPVQTSDVVDLSSMSFPSPDHVSNQVMPAVEGGMFGLLDNASSSSLSLPTPQILHSTNDMQDLKIKMENLEFKFENLIEKLSQVETRLREFESRASKYKSA